MNTMDIYGHPFSAPTREVRVLCHELSLEYRLIPVKQDRRQPYLPEALDPACRVPMLEDEGFSLSEVHAIQRYLAGKQPSSWYPAELVERALVDQWLDWQGQRFGPACALLAYHRFFAQTGPAGEPLVDQALALLQRILPELETRLERHDYLGGTAPTLADIAVASSVAYLELAGMTLQEQPMAQGWWQRFRARASWSATHPELESA